MKYVSDTGHQWTLLHHSAFLFVEAYYAEAHAVQTSWASRYVEISEQLLQGTDDEHLHLLLLVNKRSMLYRKGSYKEAIAQTEDFLRSKYSWILSDSCSSHAGSISPEPQLNAELGYLLIKYAELLVTEVASSKNIHKSQQLLELCRPVSAEHPSTIERVLLAERDRIIAKAFKDLGMWQQANFVFQKYCVQCIFPGTPHEGWAVADWAQVLMELGRAEEAERVLTGPLQARLADDFTGLSKQATRANDTILLQLNFAEARLRQGDLDDAATRYQQSLDQMLAFHYLEHPEKTRVFFAYCGLARICHLRKDWVAAKTKWETALQYGLTVWPGVDTNCTDRKHFYPAVVILSMADVCYEMDDIANGDAFWGEVGTSGALAPEKRMKWMLGIGTYWFKEMEQKMEKREKTII